jgi:SpoVK/Ycf46/Vps4 family AAA+-type ATPase
MLNRYLNLFILCVVLYNQLNAEADKEKSAALRADYSLPEQRNIVHTQEPSSEEKKIFEESFSQAPAHIKALVLGRMQKAEWAMKINNILLTGPGKTTLALAMAHKLNGKYLLVHASTLLGRYKNQTAENVKALFDQLNECKEKLVLVIDEINVLTDDHTSEHSDAKNTAAQLWTLLDTYKNNKDFFIIATTNVTNKMPHQLQTRFEGKVFSIDNPSFEARKQLIKFHIQKSGSIIDPSCDDQYLEELAKKTEAFSLRTIEALISGAHLLYVTDNPGVPLRLSKRYLEQAYSRIVEDRKKHWNFNTQTTEEERRHKEILAQNERHAKEHKDMQFTTTLLGVICGLSR